MKAPTPILLDSLALKREGRAQKALVAAAPAEIGALGPARQERQMSLAGLDAARPAHEAGPQGSLCRLPGCRFAPERTQKSVVQDPIRLFEADSAADLWGFRRFAWGVNQKIAMRQVRRRATDWSACTSGRPSRPAKRSRKNPYTSDIYEALPRKPCPAEAFDCFLWICSRIDSLMLRCSILIY
jgi:hypothetical protein